MFLESALFVQTFNFFLCLTPLSVAIKLFLHAILYTCRKLGPFRCCMAHEGDWMVKVGIDWPEFCFTHLRKI